MRTRSNKRSLVFATALLFSTAALTLTGCAGQQANPSSDNSASPEESNELHAMLPDAIKEAGTIVIGGAFEDPPLLSADPADPAAPVGLAPDLAAAVAERLGVTITWQNLGWNGQLPALTSGRIDALMGQISDTVERETAVVDMVPFWRGTTGLAVVKGNPLGVAADLSTLCGTRIGVTSGSTEVTTFGAVSEDVCAGKDPISVVEYASFAPAMTALSAGGVDAVANGYSVLLGVTEANPDQYEAVNLGADFAETYNPEAPGINAIATNKANPALAEAIAAALRELSEERVYQDIVAQWDSNPDAVVGIDMLVVNPLSGTPAGEIS